MKGDAGLLCGLGPWRPSWLQKFNSSKGFLVVYGLLGTIQAMSYIYFVATLTTLEKRFKISSKTTGLMMSGNEISQVLLSLILSYYGGQRNRPLWIAWGVAFSAASCYILAMPHLLYGPGEDALALTKEYTNTFNSSSSSKDQASLCVRGEEGGSHCELPVGGEFSNIPALLVFFSQFVLGIGTTLYYALGQTYLDDNTKKSKTPLLLSLTMSLRTIGPAIGFIVGYGCLRLYIAPTLTPIITNKDPRWLGAWWLGWLILGTAMLLFSFLIAMFPKKMPPSKSKVGVIKPADITLETVRKTEKEVEFKNGVSREKLVTEVESEAPPTLKEFPAALARLLRNKLLMANILSGVFYILGGSAYITYITKYMEIQFHQSAAGASFIIGPTAILSMTSGFLISGAVISKFKPRPTYLLGWNVLVGISFVIGELSFIFLSCEDSSMVGFRGENELPLINECNNNCGCNSLKFSPVCLEQAQLSFYTACHAGCQQADYSASPITFTNCSCIPDDVLSSVSARKDEIVLKTGACRTNCYYNFVIFIGITMVMHSLGSSGKIGNVLVNYRAVAAVDKSFAQGLGLLMVSLFAFIPGPILYGAMIDSTCLVWDETCGRRGNCWLYDKYRLRYSLNVTSACLTLIGVLFDALVCYLGGDLKLYEDEEDSNKNSLNSTVNGKHEVLPPNDKPEKA
ncbi:solute carrier organic anion transporter family member 74D-like [Macrosteles quadrilineatus]|uniref:solute carrier organic anion transporter family member 74D-like n=1 Tax=Macrosteles quadrilineatus TaxID=74068 RepID=UPI0023E23F4B|nr:solute carrier organic anion transporter family member 74D-like [Macrosteles quadrilineatus]